MASFEDLDIDKVSDKIAKILSPHFKSLTSIQDIMSLLLEDPDLTDTERLFAMFSMGRRFENNRLYTGMQDLFKFGGKLTDPDPEEDEPEEKV